MTKDSKDTTKTTEVENVLQDAAHALNNAGVDAKKSGKQEAILAVSIATLVNSQVMNEVELDAYVSRNNDKEGQAKYIHTALTQLSPLYVQLHDSVRKDNPERVVGIELETAKKQIGAIKQRFQRACDTAYALLQSNDKTGERVYKGYRVNRQSGEILAEHGDGDYTAQSGRKWQTVGKKAARPSNRGANETDKLTKMNGVSIEVLCEALTNRVSDLDHRDKPISSETKNMLALLVSHVATVITPDTTGEDFNADDLRKAAAA